MAYIKLDRNRNYNRTIHFQFNQVNSYSCKSLKVQLMQKQTNLT